MALIALAIGAGTAAAVLVTGDDGKASRVQAPAKPKGCAAVRGCFPKPPGHGLGSTGIPSGTKLRDCGGDVKIEVADKVIDGCRYTGNVLVAAQDVTIRRSRILGAVRTAEDVSQAGFTLEDSEIGPDDGCATFEALVGTTNYTARRNYLHGNGDGFRVSGDDITIRGNFVATCDRPGDHSDGIQGFGAGRDIRIDHNTVDLRGSTNGPTAPLFIADNSSSAEITDNLLISGGSRKAALRVHDDHTPDVGPWVVTGNRLVGTTGTTKTDCYAETMTWTDNRSVVLDADYRVKSVARRAIRC